MSEDRISSPFERLREKYSQEWPAIASARQRTEERLRDLESLQELKADNTAITVFGSFARGELTSGSDIDWSLLVDGPSDPEHFQLAQEIRGRMELLELPEPGTTETFGTLASSHELIHHIGGVRDTNQNMTRRMLLLLESRAVTNEIVRDRVVQGILHRYIVSDLSVSWRTQPEILVPRFLLNDIARFWRTMAVDYAAKRWEQQEKKWALRNAKLRLSRKLLFVAGLLTCFSFELHPPEDRSEVLSDTENLPSRLAQFLWVQVRLTPIELVCLALLREHVNEGAALDIMDSYNQFLALLHDEDKRKHLEKLSFDDAPLDQLFQTVRSLSHQFQQGLDLLFFSGDERMRNLILKYGLF